MQFVPQNSDLVEQGSKHIGCILGHANRMLNFPDSAGKDTPTNTSCGKIKARDPRIMEYVTWLFLLCSVLFCWHDAIPICTIITDGGQHVCQAIRKMSRDGQPWAANNGAMVQET